LASIKNWSDSNYKQQTFMNAQFSLQGKAVIVTGGTGILGGSFTKGIAAAGGAVGILGRNEEVAQARAAAINQAGGKAIALIADVMQETQLNAARDKMMEAFGRIDGLVNGAGGNMPEGVVPPGGDIFGLNMEGMRKVMDLNLYGTLISTQVFGRTIAENGGSIVNISSVSSTSAITRVLGYSMGKSAIDSYTRWFALEMANRYGDKVRMNALVPGFFLTEQNRSLLTNPDGSFTSRGELIVQNTPFKRLGDPDELIGALVWLLSDASSFVTGTTINVDGGFLAFSGV
jgi:NAD(P)-dependent dehydrogenase (short-subunit alcohol dehydrogenase family)